MQLKRWRCNILKCRYLYLKPFTIALDRHYFLIIFVIIKASMLTLVENKLALRVFI
jgi:hypothetical protein